MAFTGTKMGLIVVVLASILCAGVVTAQTQSGCSSAIIGLSPCLNYITGNSSTPSSSCCSQLSSVVSNQPQCLCQVLSSDGSSLGISINKTQALQLPQACSVQTPPLSRCNSAGSPTGSPAGTADPPAGSADTPATPAGTGSKTVPSADGNSSDGTVPTSHFSLLFITLLIASYAST